MSEQVKVNFFESKAFRRLLLAALAIILLASNTLGRSKMTLAGEKQEARVATQQELVEAR